MSKFNLILDLDGTLISEASLGEPAIFRKHIHEFLKFAFENFNHVSIWSAAKPEWVNKYIQQLNFNFHFVWADIAIKKEINKKGEIVNCKPLKKVCKKFHDYTLKNTWIIDNEPKTFHMNKFNGIYIPTWKGNEDDTELLKMIEVLKKKLNSTT